MSLSSIFPSFSTTDARNPATTRPQQPPRLIRIPTFASPTRPPSSSSSSSLSRGEELRQGDKEKDEYERRRDQGSEGSVDKEGRRRGISSSRGEATAGTEALEGMATTVSTSSTTMPRGVEPDSITRSARDGAADDGREGVGGLAGEDDDKTRRTKDAGGRVVNQKEERSNARAEERKRRFRSNKTQWNGLEEMMQRQRETGGESLLHLIGGGGGGRSQQPTTTTSTRAEEPTETGPDKRDTKKKTARRSRIGTTDDRERRPESDLVDDRTTRTTRTKSGSPVKNGAGLLELERESPSKKKKKKRTRTEGDVNGEGKDVAMVEQETIEGHDAAGAGGTRASSAGRSVLKQRSRAPRAAVASKATTLRTMTTEEHDRGPRCGTTDARDIDGPGPSAIVVPRSMDRPALSTEVATDASPTRTSRKRGAEGEVEVPAPRAQNSTTTTTTTTTRKRPPRAAGGERKEARYDGASTASAVVDAAQTDRVARPRFGSASIMDLEPKKKSTRPQRPRTAAKVDTLDEVSDAESRSEGGTWSGRSRSRELSRCPTEKDEPAPGKPTAGSKRDPRTMQKGKKRAADASVADPERGSSETEQQTSRVQPGSKRLKKAKPLDEGGGNRTRQPTLARGKVLERRDSPENKGSLCQDVDGGGQDEVEAPVKKKKKKLNSKRSVPLEISSPHPRQIASAPDEPICPPLVPIPCGTTDAKPGPRTKKKISIHSERIKSTDSSGAKPNVFDVVVGRVREVFASLTNERVAQSKEEEEDEDDDDLDLLKDYVAEVRIATLRRSAEVSDYSALQKRLATAKAKSKELRGAIDEEQRRRG